MHSGAFTTHCTVYDCVCDNKLDLIDWSVMMMMMMVMMMIMLNFLASPGSGPPSGPGSG